MLEIKLKKKKKKKKKKIDIYIYIRHLRNFKKKTYLNTCLLGWILQMCKISMINTLYYGLHKNDFLYLYENNINY